jgi:hypothetical protein
MAAITATKSFVYIFALAVISRTESYAELHGKSSNRETYTRHLSSQSLTVSQAADFSSQAPPKQPATIECNPIRTK